MKCKLLNVYKINGNIYREYLNEDTGKIFYEQDII